MRTNVADEKSPHLALFETLSTIREYSWSSAT